MPKRPTYKEVIQALEKLEFKFDRSKGSHQVWKGTDKFDQKRMVVLAPHRYSEKVPVGTLSSIIRQSGYSKEKFLALVP